MLVGIGLNRFPAAPAVQLPAARTAGPAVVDDLVAVAGSLTADSCCSPALPAAALYTPLGTPTGMTSTNKAVVDGLAAVAGTLTADSRCSPAPPAAALYTPLGTPRGIILD